MSNVTFFSKTYVCSYNWMHQDGVSAELSAQQVTFLLSLLFFINKYIITKLIFIVILFTGHYKTFRNDEPLKWLINVCSHYWRKQKR